MPDRLRETRFIFVTGGVVSALGKGIASASIGRLLVSRGLTVGLQKFDPYINVDPGTMSDRKSTRLNSSHQITSYAVFCLKKKKEHYDVARSVQRVLKRYKHFHD